MLKMAARKLGKICAENCVVMICDFNQDFEMTIMLRMREIWSRGNGVDDNGS